MILTPRRRASVVVLLGSVIALVVIAGIWLRPAAQPIDPPAAPEGLGPGAAAMRATINPETGKLEIRAGGPPLTLDAATREALRHDDEGLKEVHHPDGTISVDLRGRYQSVSVARVGEDGTVMICSDDAKDVESILRGPAPDSPKKAEVQ